MRRVRSEVVAQDVGVADDRVRRLLKSCGRHGETSERVQLLGCQSCCSSDFRSLRPP